MEEKEKNVIMRGFRYLFCSPDIIRRIVLGKNLGGRAIREFRF
jgi:hypothetical protein